LHYAFYNIAAIAALLVVPVGLQQRDLLETRNIGKKKRNQRRFDYPPEESTSRTRFRPLIQYTASGRIMAATTSGRREAGRGLGGTPWHIGGTIILPKVALTGWIGGGVDWAAGGPPLAFVRNNTPGKSWCFVFLALLAPSAAKGQADSARRQRRLKEPGAARRFFPRFH
jgi:hypothetical protein